MRRRLIGAALAALALTGCGTAAHAGPVHRTDVRLIPRTAGTAAHHIDVSRYGVVRQNTLPHCHYEDGSGGPRPCSWNIPTTGKPFHLDGNGRGLSYWVGKRMHVHYVWPDKMLGTPVERLPELEDALVEGDRQHWRKCWLDENRTHVACPDGYRVRVYGQRDGSRSGAW